MIHLYTWNTPSGIKPLIMLEEIGVAYRLHPIDISAGEHKTDSFLSVNPNGRIPALIDDEIAGDAAIGGVRGQRVFESGSILMYLADKFGRFLPTDPASRSRAIGWVCWETERLSPMVRELQWVEDDALCESGMTESMADEIERQLSHLDDQLTGQGFLAGDYSIADMMCWPWAKAAVTAVGGTRRALDMWLSQIGDRPAVQRAQALALGLYGSAQSPLAELPTRRRPRPLP